MISTGTLLAASAVFLTLLSITAAAIIFVVNLIVNNSASATATQFTSQIDAVKSQVSVDITRMEGKLDALNLTAVWEEIRSLREWRHDLGPRQMLYDAAVADIDRMQRDYADHCRVAEGKIEMIRDHERRIGCLESADK